MAAPIEAVPRRSDDPDRRPGPIPARAAAPAAVLGVVVAAASMLVPLSYDEGNWLAVTRRVAAGEALYRDITDNKSPALFALVRGLDIVPGPYTIARGVFIGLASALLAWLSMRLLRRLGLGDAASSVLGVCFGLAGAMQAVLVANFELPAILLVVAALGNVAGGSAVVGGAIGGLAAVFDPRAAILVPGIVALALERSGARGAFRTAAAAAGPLIAWGAAVLVLDELRYSLLELNVATRGGAAAWRPGAQLTAFARSMVFPLAAVGFLTAGRVARNRATPAAILTIAGFGAAIVSVQPFDKYWTLALPGLICIAGSRRPREAQISRAWTATLLVAALAPHAVYATTSSSDQARIVNRYERAAADIDRMLGPNETFVRFDSQPFLGTFLPKRDATPAAVLDFLIAPTSREDENLAAVDRAIARSAAIVDDGALSVSAEQILPAYRRLHRVFAARLGEFPCARQVLGLTVRLRRCP